jgi:hypothetical protein
VPQSPHPTVATRPPDQFKPVKHHCVKNRAIPVKIANKNYISAGSQDYIQAQQKIRVAQTHFGIEALLEDEPV